MQLKEYFEEIKHSALTPEQKRDIYADFLRKSTQTLFIRKVLYYTKITAFSVGTAAIFLVFFATFTPEVQSPYQLTDVNDAMITYSPNKSSRTVQAGTLGKIVNIQGKIAVYQGGELISAKDLRDGDLVVLQRNARVEVTLLDGVLAVIEGPAKFVLHDRGVEKDRHVYVLELLEGDSVRVTSLEPEKNDLENDSPDETVQEEQPKRSLIVKTPTIEVAQDDISEEVDLHVEEDDGQQTITNEGSEVVVKQLAQDDQEEIIVLANQVATLDDTGVLNTENIEEIVEDIKENQLTIRYDIQDVLPTPEDELQEEAGNEEIQDKEIMSEEMLAGVERALSRTILMRESRRLVVYYLRGDRNAYDISYQNIIGNVSRAASLVGYTGPQDLSDPLKTVTYLENLSTYIQGAYYVSPSLVVVIDELESLLEFMSYKDSGMYSHVVEDEDIIKLLRDSNESLPTFLQ